MTGINPEDWRKVADMGRSYPDAIAEYVDKMLADLARAESVDILAALAAWSDIEGIDDPANILRIKYENGGPQVRVDRDDNVFTGGAPPKVFLEVPTLIVLADLRHAGTANPGHLVSVDWRRHERTYVGAKYTVALMHRDEAAKIPRQVRTATEPVNYQPETDD